MIHWYMLWSVAQVNIYIYMQHHKAFFAHPTWFCPLPGMPWPTNHDSNSFPENQTPIYELLYKINHKRRETPAKVAATHLWIFLGAHIFPKTTTTKGAFDPIWLCHLPVLVDRVAALLKHLSRRIWGWSCGQSLNLWYNAAWVHVYLVGGFNPSQTY